MGDELKEQVRQRYAGVARAARELSVVEEGASYCAADPCRVAVPRRVLARRT